MPVRLESWTPDFADRFEAFLAMKRESASDVRAAVAAIVADVRARGDEAVIELTERFDRVQLSVEELRVSGEQIAKAVEEIDAEVLAALELACERITSHHQRQLPKDDRYVDGLGVELGHRWTPVDSVGLYVPGGTAAYPSSVLMNAVPAKVAGVARIAMVVPTPNGMLNPLVLAAAQIAGIDEIYRIGGAQAVAALAYGTQAIAPVVKIVGPGNAYVAEAKRQVFGTVGIDMIAGPSEVLIIAEGDNDPMWIAADLLAQAEHDSAAQAILMTDDAGFAEAVEAALRHQLTDLPRGKIAGESWSSYGGRIVLASLDEAPALANRIAPEHLEIATGNPEALADKISNAGAIFLGATTPEAIGDYVAGSNHVLPTARSARFSSGLGVIDFMKRTSILKVGSPGLSAIGPAAMALANAEGLHAHCRSVEMRFEHAGRQK